MTEHELLQIAEHVERWYDEAADVGNPTGTFAEYIGRLLSHIGRLQSENERLKETALTEYGLELEIEKVLRRFASFLGTTASPKGTVQREKLQSFATEFLASYRDEE